MKKLRTWAIVALCGLLGALTACSSGTSFVRPGYDFSTVGRVAVLVTMNAGNPAQQQEIADLFAMQVLQKGYDVIDRANLADLTNEAAFQNDSGITSPEARAKLAIHNVSAVIVVNVEHADAPTRSRPAPSRTGSADTGGRTTAAAGSGNPAIGRSGSGPATWPRAERISP